MRLHRQISPGRRKKLTRRLQLNFEALEVRHLLAPVAWDGGGDGSSWHDPLNWDTNSLPTIDDDVTIDVAGSPTIQFSSASGNRTVKTLNVLEAFQLSGESLTIVQGATVAHGADIFGGSLITHSDLQIADLVLGSNGTLQGSGNVILTGNSEIVSSFAEVATSGTVTLSAGATLDWQGGAMESGGALVIADTAQLNLTSLSTKTLLRPLENFGTVLYSGQGFGFGLNSVNGDHLVNRPGAVFEISGSGTVGHFGPQPAIRFVNEGTLRKTGTATSKLDVATINSAAIDLQGGSLGLMAGGETTTTIDVPAGAALELGNTMLWPAGPAVIGAGDVTFSGGTSNFTSAGATYEATGRLTVSSGVVDIPNPISPASVGTLTGKLALRSDTILDSLVITNASSSIGDLSGTATVTLTGNNSMASSFGKVTTTGSVVVADGATLDWQGGAMEAGGALVIADTAQLNLTSLSTKTLFRPLENFGTVLYSGQGFGFGLNSVNGDHLVNRPGAVFEISGSGTVGHFGPQPAIRFVNEGTLRKTGTATSKLDVAAINSAAIDLQGGSLGLMAGGETTTTIDVPAGAALELGNTMLWPAGPAVIGAGDVTFSGGTSNFTSAGATYEATGRLTVSSGVVDIPNPISPASVGTLTGKLALRSDTILDSLVITNASSSIGDLSGTATVTLTGNNSMASSFGKVTTTGSVVVADGATLDWQGGAMEAGGALVIADTAQLNLTSLSTKTLFRPLENFGTVLYSGQGFGFGLNSVNGDHLVNRPGAVFEISGSGTVGHFGPQPAIRFVNEGTLRKTGTATSKLDVAAINSAAIDLQGGSLGLMAGGETTTTIDVPAGAALELGNTMLWPAGPAVIGAGDVTFSGGTSNFTSAGATYEATGRLTVSSGVVDIPNPISPASVGTLTGKLALRSDTILDSLVITNASSSIGDLSGTATVTLTGNNSMAGSFGKVTTTGSVVVADGATLDWQGGAMEAGGALVIADTAQLNLTSLSSKTLLRPLENFGTVLYSGQGFGFGLNSVNGDHLVNRPGAVFEISGSGTVGHFGPQPAIRFVNEGTLRKTGTATSKLDVEFSNDGLVEVTDGTMHHRGGVANWEDGQGGDNLFVGGRWIVTKETPARFPQPCKWMASRPSTCCRRTSSWMGCKPNSSTGPEPFCWTASTASDLKVYWRSGTGVS